ncbi:TIGR04197 family type VII secretion effector [Bacillus manliponensis]|uniref:TIGR04197 family type VII secretion effector n=1 Tax=Bacillus manliponensis TaxID=574376 RepID=UPI0035129E14
MGKFQSNFQTAEQIAMQMGRASDTVQSATSRTITKSTGTTLTVNTQAQSANDEAMQLTKQFQHAFQQGINNIRSVVKEFERMDNELQSNFSNSPLLERHFR